MYLKKYLTEGLIQVAILLSLSGMRVDVDPYLPPLQEIILGQSSALTQTQFHNLRNSLEGQDQHPKSVDLDGFFTARRLLGWVRSLDRLQLPTTELEAWLVHQEPEPLKPVSVQGGQMEGDSGLDDDGDLSGLGLRMEGGEEGGGGGIGELGYGQVAIDNNTVRGAVDPLPRGEQQDNSDNISKEDGDVLNFLWQQEADPGQQSEGPGYGNHRQPLEPLLSSFDDDDRFRADVWTAGRHYHSHGDPPFGADVQQHPDPELLGLDEEVSFSAGRPLLSPLISPGDPSMDLEQQWQDLLAIMEPQDMDLVAPALNLPVSNVEQAVAIGSINGLLHQDVSLHQASVPRVHEDAMGGLSHLDAAPTPTQHHSSSNPSDGTFSFGSHDGAANGDSDLVDSALLINLLEEPALASPLRPLLEESMLDEISLMDLALEEGINPSEMCQLEEHLEDSDSGLSLNFSHSPASPSGSEASCSSSSSSSSSSSLSSTGSFSEEGAVGYDPEYEDMEDSAEGAFGGYAAETRKVCGASYVEPSRFQHLPWLDSVSHDHTYNQPLSRNPEKPEKGCFEESPEVVVKDTFMGRDDRRARAMRVPFSTDHIINLPVEEFNMLLTRHKLSEAQLTLVRDIRRRGKNKMAAQNCRRRKLDVVVGLEHNVDGLRLRRARLLREKAEMYRSVREMKQRLSSLYEDVFSRLRDGEGRPYSDQEYSLQFNADGRVVLTSNHTSTESRCKSSKKQKDKRK
ncbi:endoplasmic reticulum membrane sensor NFE2L1a [Clupea harengus]|uniref:Endoplasmic reticulum membrane sensor NFE2L1 n=1 Tax=Clupea harengus TaxID=7950 RepID=A0A6P3WF93_CLUHA|nr:endoplasmic reticulum membrane sensor NFE2L1a [Clupea harengus]